MIVLLRPDATESEVGDLVTAVEAMGLRTVPLEAGKGRAFEVLGEDRGKVLALASSPGVQEILTRRMPLVGGEPLWPHTALRVGVLSLVLVTALGFLSVFLRPGLGDAAAISEGPAKPEAVEWYLRPLSAWLHAFPEGMRALAGAAALALLLLVFALPLVDRAEEPSPRGRLVARAVRAGGAVVAALALAAMLGVLR